MGGHWYPFEDNIVGQEENGLPVVVIVEYLLKIF